MDLKEYADKLIKFYDHFTSIVFFRTFQKITEKG